jgi:phospholipid transport system transporter-binding protein
MPAPIEPALAGATVQREGEALVFGGALQRAVVAALWPQALSSLAGARRFDLRAVSQVDSAGLAMLAELAARTDAGIVVDGAPAGLHALCEAYRLDSSLGYAG